MASKTKEELLKEQDEASRSGKKTEPSDVDKAKEDLELAKIKVESESIRAGYPMPDPVEAWHLDIEAKNKKIADEQKANILESEKLRVEREKLKTESESLSKAILENDNRQQGLNDGLAEIESGKLKIAEVYADAQKEAEQSLANFRQRVSGKTIGNIEEATRILSVICSSLVKRVSLEYSCPDCHKVNAKSPERQAHWRIPTLMELSEVQMGTGFYMCGDCEQQEGRMFPVTICDICPVRELAMQAVNQIVAGLKLAGVTIEWDADGIYKPHIKQIKEQGDTPSKEWVKMVLADTHLSEADTQRKTEDAIGKLVEEEPLAEPTDLDVPPAGEETNEEV